MMAASPWPTSTKTMRVAAPEPAAPVADDRDGLAAGEGVPAGAGVVVGAAAFVVAGTEPDATEAAGKPPACVEEAPPVAAGEPPQPLAAAAASTTAATSTRTSKTGADGRLPPRAPGARRCVSGSIG